MKLSKCATKAAALTALARQRMTPFLEVWMQEIKLRTSVRIGEFVRELEVSEQARGGRVPSSDADENTGDRGSRALEIRCELPLWIYAKGRWGGDVPTLSVILKFDRRGVIGRQPGAS
jgi:hypothetical protein